jgi:hypothetical protein
MTVTAIVPERRRDPLEAPRLHKRFAEELMKFEHLLNLGFSNDDIGRMHSKELLVEIARYYRERGQEVKADNYADFEELTNESLT